MDSKHTFAHTSKRWNPPQTTCVLQLTEAMCLVGTLLLWSLHVMALLFMPWVSNGPKSTQTHILWFFLIYSPHLTELGLIWWLIGYFTVILKHQKCVWTISKSTCEFYPLLVFGMFTWLKILFCLDFFALIASHCYFVKVMHPLCHNEVSASCFTDNGRKHTYSLFRVLQVFNHILVSQV